MTADEYGDYLESSHWMAKRQERIALDNHKCKICGTTDNLRVHHLSYSNLGNENVEDDLITLCCECHQNIHFTIDRCKNEFTENIKWYHEAVSKTTIPISNEYTQRQAKVIGREISKLDKSKWQTVQSFVKVLRNSIKIDKRDVSHPGWLNRGGTMLHFEAIKEGKSIKENNKHGVV